MNRTDEDVGGLRGIRGLWAALVLVGLAALRPSTGSGWSGRALGLRSPGRIPPE